MTATPLLMKPPVQRSPRPRPMADRRFPAARAFVLALALSTPALAETVGPGTEGLSSTAAASLFARVCIETRPKLAKAKAELASLGYVAHPDTGTFYDNRLDVSFKLLRGEGVCSRVIRSDDDPMQVVLFLSVHGRGLTTPASQFDQH
ncbi:MAG: hypothetical protein B7Z38_07080 [Rhodobacterales bacterium 12-64-8]|nr:MAG: hypothetical protein B7Z38_07080 [Rhodobacterales bacterium 12-64-8]